MGCQNLRDVPGQAWLSRQSNSMVSPAGTPCCALESGPWAYRTFDWLRGERAVGDLDSHLGNVADNRMTAAGEIGPVQRCWDSETEDGRGDRGEESGGEQDQPGRCTDDCAHRQLPGPGDRDRGDRDDRDESGD